MEDNLSLLIQLDVVALELCFLEIMENIYVSETYRYIASKRKEEIYSSSRIEGTNVN